MIGLILVSTPICFVAIAVDTKTKTKIGAIAFNAPTKSDPKIETVLANSFEKKTN